MERYSFFRTMAVATFVMAGIVLILSLVQFTRALLPGHVDSLLFSFMEFVLGLLFSCILVFSGLALLKVIKIAAGISNAAADKDALPGKG